MLVNIRRRLACLIRGHNPGEFKVSRGTLRDIQAGRVPYVLETRCKRCLVPM